MDNSQTLALPAPQYQILRLPNGKHSGVAVDLRRWVLEVQRDGIKYYFDLTQLSAKTIENTPEPCYTGRQR